MKRKKKRQPQQKSGFKYGDVHKYLIDPETECWIWQGARRATDRRYKKQLIEGRRGRYGVLRDPRPGPGYKKLINAHQFFWELHTGLTLPPDKTLDHFICDFGLCVNPEHLQVADMNDNIARGLDKRWGNGAFTKPQQPADVPF